MKKRMIMAAVLGLALMAAGCSNGNTKTTEKSTGTEAAATEKTTEGGSETTAETTAAERPSYTALDYVTLGEYKGLKVTLASTDVTDAEIDAQVASALSQNEKLETVEKGTVEDGDIANIDYEGVKDGEAFEGGTDKGYELTIGSNTFIDGFESGLIGKEIGADVDLNLTFPETYGNADLAGKEVVFHVTINSVKRAPELTDALAAEISDYKTVSEYKDSVKKTLQEQKASTQKNQEMNDLMSLIYENSKINDYPKELVAYNKKQYTDYYTSYAEQAEMSFADFLKQNLQMTEEEFDTQIEETVKQSLRQELLLKAIAETEKLTISDEEYKTGAEKYLTQLGVESVEALEKQYGKTMVETNLLLDKAMDLVVENAVVTDPNKAEGESETSTEAGSEKGTEAATEASSEKESETTAESQSETETASETQAETKAE